MAITRDTQAHLAKGEFDAIEGEWLAAMGQDPLDLDYFIGVARALTGTGQEERARLLLEMFDEQLRESGRWDLRRKLLQRGGSILLPPDKLHPAIFATLKRLYGDRSIFQGLADAVGLQRATHDIPKTWEKVEKLESLLAFDVGTVVAMEGKGVGRIAEANLGLESFKVDFERIKGMTVGFKAAAKLLQPLSPDHVLRRKLEDREALAALKPPQLLQATLQSYDRPLTAGEIREILNGIVTESQWTSWWSAARKHGHVVATGTGSRQTYRWAESSSDAVDTLWKAFEKADPRKKIERLKRDGARDPGLRALMAKNLEAVADRIAGQDPGLAFEIWFALERTGGAPEDVDWSPEELLLQRDPTRLFAGIEDRLLRERAYAMVRERREDWPDVYRGAMTKETDPRALDMLADGLRASNAAGLKELERFYDTLFAQPHRYPAAFTWLAERAAVDEMMRARNPLRLLQQILGAPARDEFAAYRLRLLALAESGGTVPRLLTHLTHDQAAQAEDAVQRSSNLEPFQREQLVNAIQLRFPAQRKDSGPEALYATTEQIEAKQAELHRIMTVEVPANRKAIEEARAMGDLRENFEYKSARQRHEYLNARAAALNADLSRARPIETANMDMAEVRIGTRVRLSGKDGSRVVTILGPWESKPEEDILSYESEQVMSLLGKKAGDEISLAGETWRIETIEPWR
ncbi:MAG TPA: GreA/GreB family elongation factor [Thermoanaerobaculia bacterium]|nr:GreA/GreB family elongation factor [Thermoanaerobaculia bacterium]